MATVPNCVSSTEACEKGYKKGEPCLRREISFAAPLGGKEDILRHSFQDRQRKRGETFPKHTKINGNFAIDPGLPCCLEAARPRTSKLETALTAMAKKAAQEAP